MNKQDDLIRKNLQRDTNISEKADAIFKNFKEEIKMEGNKNGKKVIKISLQKCLALVASFVLVIFLGANLYAHSLGKPNIYTAIRNLFNVNKENYNASEDEINITKESNGVKLTLKTAAMDDNVLILKYEAEGEKIENAFFTYQDLEDKELEAMGIQLYNSGWKIEGDFEGKTAKDVVLIRRSVIEALTNEGLKSEEAEKLENKASKAYLLYLQSSLSPKDYSASDAEKAMSEVVAEYENKLGNKENILLSKDYLSNIEIESASQTIERDYNKCIIYNIYPVDTLSDLSDTFELSNNINNICGIEGEWQYNVTLNKARLNTRVETINFNKTEDILGSNSNEYIKVTVKKLAISDFSSVLMIQKDSSDTNEEKNTTFTYVVTDEEGNVVGKNGLVKEDEIYTTRIILKNVNNKTKKLKVYVYSNVDNNLYETINLDIESARNAKEINLARVYTEEENIKIQFNYPMDWEEAKQEDVTIIQINSPKDVDGKYASIEIQRGKKDSISEHGTRDWFKNTFGDNKYTFGYPKIDELDAFEYQGRLAKTNNNDYIIDVVKGDYAYTITYTATSDAMYERYSQTFLAIIDTVKLLDESKDKGIVYTMYEDNTNNYLVRIPKINIDSAEIEELNKQIEKDGKEINSEYEGFDYKAYVNNNILSLVTIREANENDSLYYKIYNIDISSKKIIKDYKEILKIKGISEETFIKNLKIICGNDFIWKYRGVKDPNDIEGKIYQEQYNRTIADENYKNIPIYLAQEGRLSACVKIYSIAGPDYYENLISYSNDPKPIEISQEDNLATIEYINTAESTEVIKKFVEMYYEGPQFGRFYMEEKFNLKVESVSGSTIYGKSNMKYADFEDFMNSFIEKDFFESLNIRLDSQNPAYKNENGMLYVNQRGGAGARVSVKNISQIKTEGNKLTYEGTVYSIDGEYVENNFSIELIHYDNGYKVKNFQELND